MFAIQLISKQVQPIRISDDTESAIVYMQELNVNELPVVHDQHVIGYISVAELLGNMNRSIAQLLSTAKPICAKADTHLFDLLKSMSDHHLDAIAIEDEQEQFAGIVLQSDLPSALIDHSLLSQPGASLVIETSLKNYSLSEIARIIESNGVHILHTMLVSDSVDSEKLYLNLRIHTLDTAATLASLSRFGYNVVYCSIIQRDDSDENRLKWLMKFINT